MNNRTYFSLTSGELYELPDDEIKNLDSNQIPLLKRPSTGCKKCYGRFHVGHHYNLVDGEQVYDYYVPCPKCSKKLFDPVHFAKIHSETVKNSDIELSDNDQSVS